MVGYVEKLINFMSNITALVAKDASFTSAPNQQGPPLTPDNIVVQEFSANLQPNTIFPSPPSTSTSHPIAFRIENPMVTNGEANYHHDNCQPTDLAALQADIIQTFATFITFLDTLTPLPTKTAPVQPSMAPTSVSIDNNDVPCTIGC